MNTDPVLARRLQAARLATLAKRMGYAALVVAIAAFVAAMATGNFRRWGPVVVGAMVATTVTLPIGLVLGYAVSAAQRDDT